MRVKRAYNVHTTERRWTSLSYELFLTHLRSLCTLVCEKYVVQSLLQIKPKPFFCRTARFKKDLCCSRAKLCDWKAGPDFCLITQASWQAPPRGTAETPRALHWYSVWWPAVSHTLLLPSWHSQLKRQTSGVFVLEVCQEWLKCVCVCAYVCVSMCVCERERERLYFTFAAFVQLLL